MKPLTLLVEGVMLLSLLLMLASYPRKDTLPEPDYYAAEPPAAPKQTKTQLSPFETEVNGERYRITPRFDYVLEGVVVSAHDADALDDIWHHDKWRDFLNTRDLCVIWGDNLSSGVYQQMRFENGSWTCRAYFPDSEVFGRFNMAQLSNNHLLTDDPAINDLIMEARIGDRVRLKGQLANYRNLGNGFFRNTSTVRTDTGDGACETIYVREFEIVERASTSARQLFDVAKWTFAGAVVIGLLLLFLAPVRGINE